VSGWSQTTAPRPEERANLNVSYSHAAEVLPFVVETAVALGLDVVDCSSNVIYRSDGFRGFSVTLENRAPLPGHTLTQIHDAVGALTPDGGPAYLILESSGADYAQAAGGNGVYTAEWRVYSGAEFTHGVARHPGRPSSETVEIPEVQCSGASIPISGAWRG
jgi:hypothetical protein